MTHKALFGYAGDRAAWRRSARRAARVFADLMRFFMTLPPRAVRHADTPIHDAVAVAAVALPHLVTTAAATTWTWSARATSRVGGPWWTIGGQPGQPPNVDVALDIDRAAFADLLIGAVAAFR